MVPGLVRMSAGGVSRGLRPPGRMSAPAGTARGGQNTPPVPRDTAGRGRYAGPGRGFCREGGFTVVTKPKIHN